MYIIKANVIPLQEYACGSGLSGVGYADSIVIKTQDDLPYIPHSHLKGKIRDAVEDICSFTKNSICEQGQRGGSFCGIYPIDGKDENYLCPICQIFGSTVNPACFTFSSAKYSRDVFEDISEDIIEFFKKNDRKKNIYNVEHSTRINSDTKTALEKHLRSKEIVTTRLPLEFKISQRYLLKYEEDLIIRILLAGLRFTRFIGSRRTTGRGNIIIDNISVYKDGDTWGYNKYKKEIEELLKI